MNTAAIYIKTQPEVKAKAQEIARYLGLSLSSLMDAWLRQLTEAKSLTLSSDAKPSPYLIKSLKESKKNIKEGRVLSFDTGGKAVKYFQSLEENE